MLQIMHKKLTERNLREMLKIALVFLHKSGEYSKGDIRVYHSGIYVNDYNNGVVDLIFEDLFGRQDNIHY